MRSYILSISCIAAFFVLNCRDESRGDAQHAFARVGTISRAALALAAVDRARSALLIHQGTNSADSTLERFFALLSDPARKRPVRILHYGDSILWSDLMTARIRTRLTNIFGNGGRGLMPPALEAADNQLSGIAQRQWGNWQVSFLQTMAGYRQEVGITLRRVETPGMASVAEYDLAGDSGVERVLLLTEPGSGSYSLYGRTQSGEAWSNCKVPCTNAFIRHSAPAPLVRLRLVADPGTVLYGISLEQNNGGIVYSPVMRRGICSHDFPDIAPERFRAQLAAFAPDLVVFQFGKNEAGWDKYTLDKHMSGIHWMASNLKAACPAATLLLFGPGPRINTWASPPRVFPSVGEMNTAQRELALAGKAVWFDSYTALGKEEGFMAMAWQGLVMPDYVHLTYQGGDILGDIFTDALLEEYGRWKLEKMSQ